MNRTYEAQPAPQLGWRVVECNGQTVTATGLTGDRRVMIRAATVLNEAYQQGRRDAGRDIARAAEDLHTAVNTAAVIRCSPDDDRCCDTHRAARTSCEYGWWTT